MGRVPGSSLSGNNLLHYNKVLNYKKKLSIFNINNILNGLIYVKY